MSLYKRILISVLSILAILYGVVFTIQYNAVWEYLNEQQVNTVANSSNSLAMMIPVQYEKNSDVGIESAIFAAFDSGYYREISFRVFKGDKVIQRKVEHQRLLVPGWFDKYLGFEPVNEKILIASGWVQIGELKVVSNTAMATHKLWQGTVDLSLWFLAAFLATSLVINRVLVYILRPLCDLTRYAEELGNNRFSASVQPASVSELQTLTLAMEKMAGKLKHEYELQEQEVQELRYKLLHDVVSGLGNRESFMAQIESYLKDTSSCTLFMVSCDSLADVYLKYGFGSRDKVVGQIGLALKQKLEGIEHLALSRISGKDFMFCIPRLSRTETEKIASIIHSEIKKQFAQFFELDEIRVSIGIAITDNAHSVSQVLSMVDNAQQTAKGLDCGFHIEQDDKHSLSKTDWLNVVRKAVISRNYQFRTMPAIASNDCSTLHHEVYLSIKDGDNLYHAGEFVHIIEQHGLCAEFDRSVIESVVNLNLASSKLVVNLMSGTFASSEFTNWFLSIVSECCEKLNSIAFEIPESAFVYHTKQVDNFINILNEFNVEWGVDNFGRHFKSLDDVVIHQPHYVKLDYLYVSMLSRKHVGSELISAIIKSAKNFDIQVFATRIESEKQRDKFIQLGVDGYQGYITKPHHDVTR